MVAVGLAKPQYNYGNGVSGTFGSLGGGSLGGGFGGFSGGGSNGGFSAGPSSFGASSFGGGGFGGNSALGRGSSSFGGSSGSLGGSSSFGGSSFGGSSSYGGASHYHNGASSGHAGQFEAPIVHKQFITVSAPEDQDSLSQTKRLVIGRPQKNYRVVFIKAPASSNANVKFSAEYAPQEEKTVIYVLSKKDSSLDVGEIATPAPTVPSKPEVFFIKYKTEEEAQHAQRQIQAEYDKIEGSSEHTDAGVAPQQSVVGILDGGNAGGNIAGGSNGGVTFGDNSFGTSGGSSGSFGTGTSGSFSTRSSSSGFGISGPTNAGSASYLPPNGH
uniref:DUF243 domain-containing protein n=2 Tax=Stomoxys calcitrans TaxID=35570 RepID=A0A1I8NZ62_STOCA